MNKCWICRRTKKELQNEKVVEFEKNKLIKLDSMCYTTMPFVCNVCLELITCYLVNQQVTFDDEAEGMIKESVKELFEEGVKINITK